MKEVFLPAGNGHAGSAGSVGPRRHWRSAAAGPTSPKRGGNSTLRGAVSGDVFDEPPPPKAEGLFLAVDPLAAFVAFLTPALVLFSSTSIADVHKTDAQRLAFALVAVGLALIASAVTVVWAHYQQTHTPAETAGALGAVP